MEFHKQALQDKSPRRDTDTAKEQFALMPSPIIVSDYTQGFNPGLRWVPWRELEEELMVPKRVLVVDDTCDLLELLGKVLASLGWDAIFADSGQEALNKVEYKSPSIILLDMKMPEMDGFELARILKKERAHRNIPILAVSAYPSWVVRERCLAAGCDDFISKPFEISALDTRLRSLVAAQLRKAIKV